jgi:predicted DNA-binding ArsR family transcriptional regulator
VFGKVSEGWIKLETGDKYVGKRVIGALGILKNAFHDYYIMPKPNEFLYA